MEPIRPLMAYHAPKDDALLAISKEDAERMDAENAAALEANRARFLAAHKVAEMIDPTNRDLRSAVLPEPGDVMAAWTEAQAKKEQAEG